jgi:hypothetical protein
VGGAGRWVAVAEDVEGRGTVFRDQVTEFPEEGLGSAVARGSPFSTFIRTVSVGNSAEL